MARMRTLADRAEQLLGSAVVSTTPVAGGDICTSTRLRLSDGRSALIKTRPHAPEGFFEAEARGLRWLAEPAVAPVAEVLGVTEPTASSSAGSSPAARRRRRAAALGRMLARLHASGAEQFGADEDGFIGDAAAAEPSRPTPGRSSSPSAGSCRTSSLAADRGQIDDDGRRRRRVRGAPDRRPRRPQPSRRPGCTATCGRATWSGTPSATPSSSTRPRTAATARPTWPCSRSSGFRSWRGCSAAYEEVSPLADGWEDRQPLHQLFPLLVHAALFGGRYGQLAGDAAAKLA